MTAPSPAGLSPLLDQLDEARAKGTVGPWWVDGPGQRSGEWWIYALGHKFARREDAELIVAAVNALPELVRLAREREELRQAVRTVLAMHATECTACATEPCMTVRALTAALTPGADTAGATA